MATAGVNSTAHASRSRRPYSHVYTARTGMANRAWKAVNDASARHRTAAAYSHFPRRSTAATYNAIAAIQNARNGMSDSKELPLTTKVGTATNSRLAQSGCG